MDVSSQLLAMFYILILFLVCSDLFRFVAQPIITRLVRHVTQQLYIGGQMATRKHAGGSGRPHTGDRGGPVPGTARGHTASLHSVSLNFNRSTKVALYESVVAGSQQWRSLR